MECLTLRPQPLGLFPHQAAHLLLPPIDEGCDADIVKRAHEAILRGSLDVELPAPWEFFRYAAQGDNERALVALNSSAGPATAMHRYNAWVLAPSMEGYHACKKHFQGALAELCDAVAYAQGLTDTLSPEQYCDGELQGWYRATMASLEWEQQNLSGARQRLKEAIQASESTSPLLASMLHAQSAEIGQAIPGFAVALIVQDWKDAIRMADKSGHRTMLGELWMKLGMALQNASHGQRGLLLEAISAYQNALYQGIDKETDPELFAMIQNNLGLAYLAMPQGEASHQLRSGIALQSFRYALEVYDRESQPEMWATVSMNLANAMQYLPSSHPEQNLIQAVEVYDSILEIRTKERDPVAYALVLLNQANALAHLGIFKPALEKVSEAYKLFQWYDQAEQATAARELLEQIHERIGECQAVRGESCGTA
ncbi:MAG: hypothetical protein U0905_13540 [Pirellulales bacterium]